MKNRCLLIKLLVLSLVFSLSQLVIAAPVFPRLAAELNEPRGHCLDLSGYDENIRWKKPVQAHTCKHDITQGDQIIESDDINEKGGRLYMPVYDICLQAENTKVGAKLMLSHCDDEALQQWKLTDKGQFQPVSDSSLCVTIGTDKVKAGTPPDTPQFWISPISLKKCDESIQDLQAWKLQPPEKYNPGPGARMKP